MNKKRKEKRRKEKKRKEKKRKAEKREKREGSKRQRRKVPWGEWMFQQQGVEADGSSFKLAKGHSKVSQEVSCGVKERKEEGGEGRRAYQTPSDDVDRFRSERRERGGRTEGKERGYED